MALDPGTRFGPYEILAPAGAGGMAEVYRARDTRLDRSVAIKVLPRHLSSNAAARQRFEREARAISSLAHPHICVLHDIGQQDGVDFLVLEFLEGETLATRLRKGPLPTEQLLRIAIEIADALDKAHRQGVVHRDLKPGNVMLTRGGAKLMDFGLARTHLASGPSDQSTLATHAGPITEQGTIVGTFQYMSPEQLEGKDADARSDIFAFGAMLYEMATGRRAFEGSSQASVIAAIMEREPPPLSSLQPMTPPSLERLVKICLAKDPDERWQTAHDLKLEMEWIAEGGSQAGVAAPVAARRKNRERVAWAAAGLLLLTTLGLLAAWWRVASRPAQVIRASITAPAGARFLFTGDLAGPPALSPDGLSIAFVAVDREGKQLLWVRRLDSSTAQPLAGTEMATFPFWSPDSRNLGYFAIGKLRTIAAAGGPPNTVCDAPIGRGGAWSRDGVILFSPDFRTPIFRVDARGGAPTQVTRIDAARHTSHRWPCFLSDGRHFVYFAVNHDPTRAENDALYVASIDGGESSLVSPSQTNGLYASGRLLFMRQQRLMAAAIDLPSGKLRGEPIPVADDVGNDASIWRGIFTVSDNGMLAFQPGQGSDQTRLVWFGRDGKELGSVGEVATYFGMRLAPDGRRLAVSMGNPSDIWVLDLARAVPSRLTFEAGTYEIGPVWSPDGTRIAYGMTNRPDGRYLLFEKQASGAGGDEQILEADDWVGPVDWSRDGRYLLYVKGDLFALTRSDVWVLPMTGERKPFALLSGPFVENDPRFSPDGRWVAYVSNESGRNDIYVTSFPAGGGKWQISPAGGVAPRWRQDGRELYYITPNGTLTATSVEGKGSHFEVGGSTALFVAQAGLAGFDYDTDPSTGRFLFNTTGERDIAPITLVTDWTAALAK